MTKTSFHDLGSEQPIAATVCEGAWALAAAGSSEAVSDPPPDTQGNKWVSDADGVEVSMTPAEDEPWDQQPMAYMAQNLQCRWGNPKNRCFANSQLGRDLHGGLKSLDITHLASLKPL